MEYKRSNSQISKHSLITFFRNTLTILLFLCSFHLLVGQTSTSDKKAEKLYVAAQEFYQKFALEEAKELLLKATERDPNFIEAHTLLAYVYIDSKQETKAKKSFENAIKVNPTKIPNNLYFLGEIEFREGDYEKAKKYFSHFTSLGRINPKLADASNRKLANIDFAIQAKQEPYPFEPVNMGPSINSEFSEYFPSISVDENTLLFTRRLPAPKSPLKYNEDFYIAHKKNGSWSLARNLGKPINSEINEGAPSIDANGQLMIYAACELFGNYGNGKQGKGSCDLFYSVRNNKTWSNPINLGSSINTSNWETQPSFSADGKSLYFIRGEKGVGQMNDGNIYVATLQQDGAWSKPTPLNGNINTKGNEESVLIHPDGKTLYFSSDGHVGMGGLDIYMSKRNEEGEWGPAINLGYPINTHKNENSLLVSPNGKFAIFASDREGGLGELDLYQFNLPQAFAPNKITYFAGKIYDQKTKNPLGVRFELVDLETKKVAIEAFSDKSTGEFLVTLPAGKNYALNASKKGYLFYSENFSLVEYHNEEPYIQEVPLIPIEEGEKIVLKNIFFETAQYNLEEESEVELNKLIAFLQKNPSLKVEIGGHTDNVGNSSSNVILSQNRAKSVIDFLIANGIESNRLNAKGYGANNPIADNNSEKGRAKNRRTEFKIIAL